MYLSIYSNLCSTRRDLKEQYKPKSNLHRHHILPRHAGGLDIDENYTYLTPREHKIAHFLLWKIHKNPNDLRAMHMLGVELTSAQRKITGEFCRDNKIGFFNPKYDHMKSTWSKQSLQKQKDKLQPNSFYFLVNH